MLFIHNDLVMKLLNMKDCIAVQEKAFAGLEDGHSQHRPRIDMYIPCELKDGYYRWGTMEGACEGMFTIRMKSDVMSWPKDKGTEEKYCVKPGTWCGLVMMFSSQNGEPLGFINDGEISRFRVGGGAGIGAKYLAKQSASKVGMLGSGGMARSYLDAFCAVRPIKSVKVYSPTKANREKYAQEMAEQHKIEVIAVDTPEEAVRGTDIVSSCTDSMGATIKADWLEPGMFITDLGEEEVDDACLAKIDVKLRQGDGGIPLPETKRLKHQIGHSPIAYIAGTEQEMKRLPPKPALKHRKVDFGWPNYCDLINGRVKGRENDRQITFYHNFGYQGLQFCSVAAHLYRLAKSQGVGREFPTEWFLQDIRD